MNQKNISKLATCVLILLLLFSTHGFAQLQLQKTATSGGSVVLTGENNGEWLRWDDGVNFTSVGVSQGCWTSAILFDTDDLASYDGWVVTKILVYQFDYTGQDPVIKIWQGPDINKLTEHASQSFEMQYMSWIEVELDKPYIIDADKVLVFGVEWEDIPQGFYAAGLDEQSDHPGKGDLALLGTYPGDWIYLNEIGIYGDWNKAIYVEPLETYTVTFEITDAKTGEEIDDCVVTLDDKTNEPGNYIFDNILPGTYEYMVEAESYFTYEGEVEVVDADVTVEVEMEPEVYTVTFMVEDSETKEPIVNATVTFDGEEYMTDNDGTAVIEDVYPSVYDYMVEKEGYITVEGEVEVKKDVTIEVSMIPEYYYPLVKEKKEWSCGAEIIDLIWTNWIRFEGDTVINGYNYKKVIIDSKYDGRNILDGYIREDSLKKVYYMNTDFEEGLIYDFNVNVGDTVNIHNRKEDWWDSDCPFFNELQLIVDSIYHKEILDGTSRKVIVVRKIDGTSKEKWIEGIGSNAGVLKSGNYVFPDNSCFPSNLNFLKNYLMCYYENDSLVYLSIDNPRYPLCSYHWVNIDDFEQMENFITIFPNPVYGNFFKIKFDRFFSGQVFLYTIYGKLIYKKQITIPVLQFSIALPDVSAGVYVIKTQSESDKINYNKVIISK